MSDSLTFSSPPSVLRAYANFIRHKRPGLSEGEKLPLIQATLSHYMPRYADVRAYEEICSLPFELGSQRQQLPLLYPQVLAAPLHVQLLSHPDFPISSAGLVHVRNTVTQYAPVPLYTPLDIEVSLGPSRRVAQGLEFDILTLVDVEGELLWEATTTILQKSPQKNEKSSGEKKQRARIPDASSVPEPDRSLTLRVPEDQGRRYAMVCKDFNPIHMHALTAKAFGFPRAIAHGMWTLGRSLGELAEELPQSPRYLEVAFKRPVLLPSTILLTSKRHLDGSLELAVTTPDGAIPHLEARLLPITEVEDDGEEE